MARIDRMLSSVPYNQELLRTNEVTPAVRLKYLDKILEVTGKQLLPDRLTKKLYEFLRGRRYPDSTNFASRKRFYESHFRRALKAGTLPDHYPYVRRGYAKSRREKFNRYLYPKFYGGMNQNTALIHFLALKEKRRLTPERTRVVEQTRTRVGRLRNQTGRTPGMRGRVVPPENIRGAQIVSLTRRSFNREKKAQALRKRAFKNISAGDYTFIFKRGTAEHRKTSLYRLFPNEKTLTVNIGYTCRRRGRLKRRKGMVMEVKRRGWNFYPVDTRKFGRGRVEIWEGDVIKKKPSVFKLKSDPTKIIVDQTIQRPAPNRPAPSPIKPVKRPPIRRKPPKTPFEKLRAEKSLVKLSKRNFLKEKRAQRLRMDAFKDISKADYTFIYKVGTAKHANTSLGQLFPNTKEMTIKVARKRNSKSRALRKVGSKMKIIRKGSRFYPVDTAKFGGAYVQIWQGDKITKPKEAFYAPGDKANIINDAAVDIVAHRRPTQGQIVARLLRKRAVKTDLQRRNIQLRRQTQLNKTIRQLPGRVFAPALKVRPKLRGQGHMLLRRAFTFGKHTLNFNATGCAQFAFRALGKVGGKELLKRGVMADAWTMYHSIRNKERADGVPAGTYGRLAGGVNLETFYSKRRGKIDLSARDLNSVSFRRGMVSAYKAAKGVIKRNGVAFITLMLKNSGNQGKSLSAQRKIIKKGRRNETTYVTHIEVLTGNYETDFMGEELAAAIGKKKRKGDYFSVLLDTYVENVMKHDSMPRGFRSKAGRRRAAINRLRALMESGTQMYLTDKNGKKREIKMVEGGSAGLKFVDVKTGEDVKYDPKNPEKFSFKDIHSRYKTKITKMLTRYLLFMNNDSISKIAGDNWHVVPGKVIELTGMKWPKAKDRTQRKTSSLITSYTAIGKGGLRKTLLKTGIAKSDLIYYYEGLRRVGIDPNHVRLSSALPIFNLVKLKETLFKEAAQKLLKVRQRKRILARAKSIQGRLNLLRTIGKSRKLNAKESKTFKKLTGELELMKASLVRRYIALKKQSEYSKSVADLYSQKGVARLERSIAALTGYIKTTNEQITGLRGEISKGRRRSYYRKKLKGARKFLGILEKRKAKLGGQLLKLKETLKMNHVFTITKGATSGTLLRFILSKNSYLGGAMLNAKEKKFLVQYVDRINDQVDLDLITLGGKSRYKKWVIGTPVFVPKAALRTMARIIARYRTIKRKQTTPPERISVGKSGGKFLEKKIPKDVRQAIVFAARGDSEITKLLLYVYAQEQGRGGLRKKLKYVAGKVNMTSSLGVFQIRPKMFTFLWRGEFGMSKKRMLKPRYARAFGVKNYEELKRRLKTDVNLNARVAAYLLRNLRTSVNVQLRRFGGSEYVRRNEDVYYAMITTAFNRGPNVVTRALINYKIEKIRKVFKSLGVAQLYNRQNRTPDFSKFIKKYGIKMSRHALAKRHLLGMAGGIWNRTSFWGKSFNNVAREHAGVWTWRVAFGPVEDAYKINLLAKKLKAKYSSFTSLTPERIEEQAAIFIKNPVKFLKTQLYRDLLHFARTNPKKKINIDGILLSSAAMRQKGIGRALNYGFAVTGYGQHRRLARQVVDPYHLLKLPKAKKPKPVILARGN